MSIDITNDTSETVNCDLLQKSAEFAVNSLDISSDVIVSITLVDEETIAMLHEEWLDLPGPTDVMSFPIDNIRPGYRHNALHEPAVLGEIALCPVYATKQAIQAGRNKNLELITLIVHGILHLVGFDHYEESERKIMFDLQNSIVEQFICMHPQYGVDRQ